MKTKKSNYLNYDNEKFNLRMELMRLSKNDIPTKLTRQSITQKIYFAGPWFTNRAGKLYDFCTDIYKYYEREEYTPYNVYFPRHCPCKTPKETFDSNVQNIKDCDLFVALIDEKDVGTAWEIGMAYNLGKPIILVGFDETSFNSITNLMLAYTGKCITLSKLRKLFTNKLVDDDYLQVNRDWEDIE